ncbi:hypothetical protein CP10743SC13_2460, partial [Chlamydia psittaci 10_743_SC13]
IPHLTRKSRVFSSQIPHLPRKSPVFSSRIPDLPENHVFSLQISHI